MNDEALELLANLVRCESTNPPGEEEHAAQEVAEYLHRHDVEVEWQRVAPGRTNLIVSLDSRETSVKRPTLLFCGHLDTVPIGDREWSHNPFAAEIVDGRLFGRGASDMKSGVAAMAVMMAQLRELRGSESWPIQLLLTAGEEVDSIGAEFFRRHGGMAGVGGVVIGEPTDGRVAIGHKGAYWVEMQCWGRTAHGSMPQLGVNAIDQVLKAAHLLYEANAHARPVADPVLGELTVAVTRIGGGIQTNMIPDQAFLQADMRFATQKQQQEVLKEWEDSLQRYQQSYEEFRYEYHSLLNRSPLLTPPSHPLIRVAQQLLGLDPESWRTVSYYTDGSVLSAPTNLPTLIYGPGDDRLAHQPDESVALSAYFAAIKFYRDLAVSYARGEWTLNQ